MSCLTKRIDRWLVEEDQTYHVQTDEGGAALGGPAGFDPNWQQGNDGHPGGETLSVSFHDRVFE